MIPRSYPFTHYLAAKKRVDDRALNRRVWGTMARALPTADKDAPLQVLEVGSGIGTMIERALEWSLLTHAHYTAIDAQPENLSHTRQRLRDWGQGKGYQIRTDQDGLKMSRLGRWLEVELAAVDFFKFAGQFSGERNWDLLIAHAFLDLVNLPTALPLLFDLLEPEGIFYFSLNFDGVTILEPDIDPELDELILSLYHRTMDERLVKGQPSGDSRTGRHLFTHLQKLGAEILDAGSSDWVVFPGVEGYAEEEAFFLHYFLHTIQGALERHPELDSDRLTNWVSQRRAQIEAGELVLIVHQMDFVGRPPTPS